MFIESRQKRCIVNKNAFKYITYINNMRFELIVNKRVFLKNFKRLFVESLYCITSIRINSCFIGTKQCYGSLELEIVCLIWVYKRLYTLLCSNNKYIVVFTDYNFTSGI